MIFCHCIMLLHIYNLKTYIVFEYFNVITFSGFLFCFGYAVGIAYLGKSRKSIMKKLIKNCFRTLCAFYISGLGFEFLVNKNFSMDTILNVLLLNHMPGYSEFLAGFFVLNLLTLIFFNQFKQLLSSKLLVFLALIVSLLATQIPYEKVPTIQLGLIIGSTKFASFPIVQYFGYYLLGAFFQQYKIKFKVSYTLVALICSAIFFQYVFAYHMAPLRFPPSLQWIIGGAGVLYGYYGLSIWIANRLKKSNSIYFIGEKTLQFLVISNLLIFMLKGLFNLQINIIFCLLVTIIIILVSYAMIPLFTFTMTSTSDLSRTKE